MFVKFKKSTKQVSSIICELLSVSFVSYTHKMLKDKTTSKIKIDDKIKAFGNKKR